ncbi:MAG: isocitrate lyase/phosphoenolpyruvate mutase family protein [Candidatus Eremiobacteraeota bacterium]|nr:isocitrate lyase/phosphoenolpyruvate mutase family protein [Candidatus Eremiobacteraeota bacterium]
MPPSLRSLLTDGRPHILPGAADALTARLVERAGFDAVYVTGAGVANTQLGAPDVGLLTQTEMVMQLQRIAAAVSLPILADADTGYGGVGSVARTVREYERAGVHGLHLEDQDLPKRCGHFEGKAVVPVDEMRLRLAAARDARTNPDFLIIARTDARAVEGFDAALERARAYRAQGADVIFFEAPQSVEELRAVGEAFRGVPLVANMVEGGKTPQLPANELYALGYNLIICANTALRLAAKAVQEGLRTLRETGTSAGVVDRMLTWQERQELVGLDENDRFERRLLEHVGAS